MVLVFVEHNNGTFKKAALEAVTYAKMTADTLGTDCKALVFGTAEEASELGKYGVSSVLSLSSDHLAHYDSQAYAAAVANVAKASGASVVVLNNNSTGVGITGRIAVKLDAGCASGVNSLPVKTDNGITVEKNIFSGKAISTINLTSPVSVISVTGNTIQPEVVGSPCSVESISADVPAPRTQVISQDKQQGTVAPLPEAELVVSAGRGMKGPENWGIIEALADALGATTACSRPVADTGWRPHHEHVGQTGVAIRPNLYIAAGISGAIQHLAGVNSSKCIVVINKDPEAPFFKAADYGICADLFDVVPKLTEAIKKAKA